MVRMKTTFAKYLFLGTLVSVPVFTQAPELGQGWTAEFNLAARQTLELAEAIPADKYGWRPAAGARTVSEVLMHIALGNYYLLNQAGGKVPDDTPPISGDLEKKVTAKADVVRWLKNSQAGVRNAYGTTDRTKALKFFGKDTTSDGIFLRILVHDHEHMGQMIAYARSMGVTPPWSK